MLNRFLLACSWCIDQLIPQIPRAEVAFVTNRSWRRFVWKLLCTRKSGALSEFGISRLEWLFGWNGHFSGPALRGWWGWHKWPQISLGLQEKIKNQWSWPWPTSRIKMFGISAENPWQSHVDSIVYSKATRLYLQRSLMIIASRYQDEKRFKWKKVSAIVQCSGNRREDQRPSSRCANCRWGENFHKQMAVDRQTWAQFKIF